MADGVFQQLVADAGLSDHILVDSAGTSSWHVGEKAHSGTRRILKQHGIRYNGRSRQVTQQDMSDDNTYIIAMDESNMSDLRHTFGEHPHLHRLLEFASDASEENVPDPYYHNNFEYVYQLVLDGCSGLLETIRQQEGL